MRLFRIYVDDTFFYHPQLSKLAVTEAKVEEDAENIDSLTLSASLQSSVYFNYKTVSICDCLQER